MLKLTVLVENNTFIDWYYWGEPGLSYYIECDGKRILLDTGYSDAFIRNANKMGIDLNNLDYVVISHGHDDHTGGLRYLLKECNVSNTTFISHPEIFYEKHHKGVEIGCPVRLSDIEKAFNKVILTKEPFNITDSLLFLGHIDRINNYENRTPVGYLVKDGNKQDDYCEDDSALVYKNDELNVITSCSHSGICNIAEYAKKITGINKINTIIGGFHLFNDNEQLRSTIKYLKENKIENLYPCHCVSLTCKHLMMNELDINEVGVGLSLERQ